MYAIRYKLPNLFYHLRTFVRNITLRFLAAQDEEDYETGQSGAGPRWPVRR